MTAMVATAPPSTSGRAVSAKDVQSSSGPASTSSRNRPASSSARPIGSVTVPYVTCPSSGCSRNSNEVTIPKFAPAPRMPQKSSGCSSSLARTCRPSAVTSSTDSRLSIVRPSLRCSRPIPPPSVRPATPVCETTPTGHTSPMRLRRVVERGEQRAAADAGRAGLGIDLHAVDPGEVDDDAVVARREAGDAVAAAADGDEELLLAGEAERRRRRRRCRSAGRSAPGGGRSSRSRRRAPRRSRGRPGGRSPLRSP